MNKSQLAHAVAEKCNLTKADTERAFDAMVETIIKTLKEGGEVTFTGFGTFSARQRKGRIGVNPRKPSEAIDMPSVLVAKFKAGKKLKDTLKNKR